jgi:outer membrane receptor for ferrienterochelin and colicins
MSLHIHRLLCAGTLILSAYPVSAQTTPPSEEPAPAAQEDGEEENEDIIVEATRSGRRLQDEPLRVEVLAREEIEEKLLMRPGNIALVLSETGGLRVQVTSPALGGANIRVHGLDGRYTALLADGLPLAGGSGTSLGLLQIPPTDLGQVEVIKGSVSALYGASALELSKSRLAYPTDFEARGGRQHSQHNCHRPTGHIFQK